MLASKMSSKKNENVELLTMIREHKEVLFGKFTAMITFEKKQKTWQKIFDDCAAKGHKWTNGRDIEWLKNSKYPSMKNTTKVKVDNAKKTGSGGGKEAKFNDVDNLILDIIGRDSEMLHGVNISPARSSLSSSTSTLSSSQSSSLTLPHSTTSTVNQPILREMQNVSSESSSVPQSSSPAAPSRKRARLDTIEKEEAQKEIKKNLLEATLSGQLLLNDKLEYEKQKREMDDYEQQLRIMKLENEISIFPNKYPIMFNPLHILNL